jgi:hypothetical protein
LPSPAGAVPPDPADVDEDCNGFADDADPAALGKTLVYTDADGDGFGARPGTPHCSGGAGQVANDTDCDDTDAAIQASAPPAGTAGGSATASADG